MDFSVKITRILGNIRIGFEASELVNTGDYGNIRRGVSMQCDITECQGDTDAVREDRLKKAFTLCHDGCVSMLNAAIGEAVPDSHERASPARKQALAERLAKRRAERLPRENEREENKRLAREAFESVSIQEQSCEACIGLKRNHGLNAPSCETHEAIRQTIRDEFVKGGDDEVW